MDPKEQQNQNPASYDPNRPISAVLNQEKQGFTPSVPSKITTTLPEQTTRPIIKTFESDVATSIKEQQESVARMALAEQRRREKEAELREEMLPKKKRIIFTIISILLVCIGVGALIGAYMFLKVKTAPVELPPEQTIVTSDTTTIIDVTNKTFEESTQIIAQELQSLHPENTLHKIELQYQAPDPTKENATSTFSVSPTLFLQSFFSTIPGSLARAIDTTYILGSLGGERSQPFLILTTSQYNFVYGGMLAWEPYLWNDIAPLWQRTPATSSIRFVDQVIQNRDIRALTDDTGEVYLVYGFFDRNTLVIVPSIAVYQELFQRFLAGQFK